ncbi:DUF2652 domain-containing protein [Microbacterium sp. zg.B48]|uniref:DUF2652 domain-containing protein n=1 Tax=unclassified Microbacterium TaxID=2609290 RepID=UPI00214AB499|nr:MULTISPECIES: DUF2652 domain-containing protein [unclassified Microbacterium]MCR2762320.1 DUF2652 domain-containing protein [Microbacterium sp. zg.B48]MCR2809674.1 DUF2652 domain-containing protein [Microbacterium sp. zg.B185]WIM18004.1 DUF2652 domain-containing protein [Microbacterium sp. zg-B185]
MTSERAALLIADIGGYTQYMGSHRLTLAHAEVNTARMLERMIEAARGFDLVEIEGDAAFLSRPTGARDPDTTITDILHVAVAMHRAFHLERQYVAANLCPCVGCREAAELKLKFVAHVGEVATQTIRGRIKLVGIDVILVHRLLKNSVDIPEYVLISEELYRTDEASFPEPVREISPNLEGIGTVRAYFVDVADLDGTLPPPRAASWRARLGSTFAAVGQGMPYMLGLKQPRKVR